MDKTEQGRNALIKKIEGKRVLYIATKNEDYIRLQQEINLVKRYSLESTIIVSKNKSYLKRIVYVYRRLLAISVKKYDVIFVGFMAQMIVPFWKWKFKKKTIIVDFFISIYDTLVDDRKKIKEKGSLAKLVHRLDEMCINTADCIICDTKAHGDYFKREFHAEKKTFIVLYLEADITFYHPMCVQRPIQWKDKFLVVYFGSILPVQGVNVVMRTIEVLQREKKIHFLIIGPINNKIKRFDGENVSYIDWLSQEELAAYLSFCDLCLAGHFSNTVGKADRTIPGKAYIYQAMGKKMILGDSTANRELFVEGENTAFVSRGSAIELAKKILYLADIKKEEFYNYD